MIDKHYKQNTIKKRKAKADSLISLLDFFFVFIVMLCIGIGSRITLLIVSFVIILVQMVYLIKARKYIGTYNLIV